MIFAPGLGILIADQVGQLTPHADLLVLDGENTIDAGDGADIVQHRCQVVFRLDQVTDQRHGGVGQGPVLGNHGGEIALTETQGVAHCAR